MVTFIDDDVELAPAFIEKAIKFFQQVEDKKIVLTGYEIRNGEPVAPGNLSFLGFYTKRGEDISAICINSAVFPTQCFSQALFDENIFYGTEEREMSLKLQKKGFKIVYSPEIFNYHYPSEQNRKIYLPHLFFSYYYLGLKRYYFWEPSIVKFLLFNIYAPLRFSMGKFLRGDVKGAINALLAFLKAWQRFLPFLLKLRSPFNI